MGEMSGRTEGGAKELNFSILAAGTCNLSFAAIDAQSRTALYFPHNGCVFARVAIGRAKADNDASQIQGERP
ncbi:conserved hypothetical protein [Mesorhizobium prunaredense]|uniref:Uncharacterized protein n=1 Tax=Mesorhizobium prunaredense TaxID=1631249 RepID=A0A1R3VDV3_9HYPH|nr:conserved hypothetical protein [Mesorhizobium prunaredense]